MGIMIMELWENGGRQEREWFERILDSLQLSHILARKEGVGLNLKDYVSLKGHARPNADGVSTQIRGPWSTVDASVLTQAIQSILTTSLDYASVDVRTIGQTWPVFLEYSALFLSSSPQAHVNNRESKRERMEKEAQQPSNQGGGGPPS